jgi:hypothetical protein
MGQDVACFYPSFYPTLWPGPPRLARLESALTLRPYDPRIMIPLAHADYWGLLDSKQDRKRPSSLLSIPMVPIEPNGLSTFCLQSLGQTNCVPRILDHFPDNPASATRARGATSPIIPDGGPHTPTCQGFEERVDTRNYRGPTTQKPENTRPSKSLDNGIGLTFLQRR